MEILVVGGGASGLIAAISAAKEGADVTIIEKNEKLGKKIYITGKGRCNVTNDCTPEDFFAHVNRNSKFMFSSYNSFTSQDMQALLKSGGLRLKIERGNRVFPASDHASDVTKTLEKIAKHNGVKIELNTEVKEILTENVEKTLTDSLDGVDPEIENSKECDVAKKVIGVRCIKSGKRKDFLADKIIVATGGISYPTTGSTGDGYKFAESAGHKVTKTMPSLVAFDAHLPKNLAMQSEHGKLMSFANVDISDLAGLSLKNISAKIMLGKKKIFEQFGEMLFTHTGVSGPIMITASSVIADLVIKGKIKLANSDDVYASKTDHVFRFTELLPLTIDLKPALSLEELDARLVREFDNAKNKNLSNVMRSLLPESLINAVLVQAGLDGEVKIHDVKKAERRAISETLKSFKISIDGLRDCEEAIITKGGVNVKEINPATMESKLASGLYFAGEVLDVDAYTGGFNLQIAWSTGWAAGSAAAQE